MNLVAWSWGRTNLAAGDRIAVTEMEHHSNIVPWQMVAQERGAALDWIDITDDGLLDLDSLDEVLARGPKIVAVAHVSNVLSTINPMEEIVRRAHAAGAIVVVDGSQAVPHMPVDVPRSPTSTPGPATRPTARPASACCTAAPSCSRRCRRGSAAGT